MLSGRPFVNQEEFRAMEWKIIRCNLMLMYLWFGLESTPDLSFCCGAHIEWMNESLSRWVSRPLPRLTLRFEMLLVWSHVHVLAMTELWGGYGENIGNEEERIVQEKRGSFASLVLFVGGLWFRVGGCLCLCVCSWNGSVSMLELCAALYSISPQISAHNREIDIGSSLSLPIPSRSSRSEWVVKKYLYYSR